MWKILKIAGITVAALLIAVLLVIFGVTNTDWGREKVRQFAVSTLNKSAHGVVKIGKVGGNLLHGIVLTDLSITDSAGRPFLSVERARAQYALGTFLSKKIVLSSLALERPVIVLDRPPGGEWNFARIFPSSNAPKSTTPGFGSWITLDRVRLTDGQIIVRMPWTTADSLPPAKRDSVVRAALGGQSRQRVERVPGGFQQVMDFSAINASLPHIRLADPDSTTRIFQVASLSMTAAPFLPPVAEVRGLQATFLMNADSLWARGLAAALPDTRANGDLAYLLQSGDMNVRMRVPQLAFADLRFAYPRLPSNGGGELELSAALRHKGESDYVVRDAKLAMGGGSLDGDLGLAMGDTAGAIRLHDTDLRFRAIDTRLLEQLVPNLKVPRRGTLGGRAALAGTPAAMHVDADVAFDEAGGGTTRVAAVGGVGTGGGGFRADDLHIRLDPLQVDLARIASPKLPIGGTITGTARVDGSTLTRITASADLVHRDRGAVSHLVGGGAATLRGRRWVDVTLDARPLSLVTAGRFAPALGLRGSASGRVRATGEMSALGILADLRLPDGGEFTTRGLVDLASTEKGYDLSTALRVFNLHSVMTKGPVTSITAQASAKGHGFDPKTMRASLAADLSRSAIDSLPLDSVHVRLAVADGMATLDSVSVKTPFAHATFHGTIGTAPGRDGQLAYAVEVDTLAALRRWIPGATDTTAVPPRPALAQARLARARADSAKAAEAAEVARAATGVGGPAIKVDTLKALRRDSLGGTIYTAGTVRGGLQDFAVRGRLAVRGLVAKGSVVRQGRVDYAMEHGGTAHSGIVVGAALDSVLAGGFALDSVALRASYLKPGGSLDVTVYQDTGLVYRVGTDYALLLDRNELRIRDLALQFDTTRWTAAQPGLVRWGKNGLEVQHVDLRHGTNGRIYLHGLLPTAGAMSLDVDVSGLQIANLVELLQSDVSASGVLTARAHLGGTRAAPTMRGVLGLANIVYRGTAVPDVRTTLQYANTDLVTHTDLVRTGAPLATLDANVPMNLALAGASGPRLLDRPMRVDFRADSLPLDVLPRFTDAVSNVNGRVVGVVAARGTPKHPTVVGEMGLDFATFHIVPLGVTFRELAGLVHMTGDKIVIDSIGGYSGGGTVGLRGTIGIADMSKPSFALRLGANDATVLDNETGMLHANADLKVDGPYTGVSITGTTRIVHGVIYIPETGGRKVISAGDPAVFNVVDTAVAASQGVVPGQNPLMQNLNVSVKLAVSRDTWVRSADANVEIYSTGPLTIHASPATGKLTLEGVVNTDRGTYTFMGRRFVLQRGSATFIGDPELNPLLQLAAEYEVQMAGRPALNINIIIGGTAHHPNISLTSDAQPPISQSDLLSYLAFGQPSSSLLSSQGNTGLTGQSTASGNLAGQAAALATKQLAGVAVGVLTKSFAASAGRSLGADVFNITPADLPTELSLNGVTTVLEGTQVEAGKYFTRQTFVLVQARPTFVAPGFTVQHRMGKGYRIEVSLEPRYLLRDPTLSTIQPTLTKESLGAFLIREWRF